jgi:hypothetical protein
MFIRIGYDITVRLFAPTAVIYLLRVHSSRNGDLVLSKIFEFSRNCCLKNIGVDLGIFAVALKPRQVTFVFLTRLLFATLAKLDAYAPEAVRHDIQELPPETLNISSAESVLRGGQRAACVRFEKLWCCSYEKLAEEEGMEVKYSTLTRRLRQLGISKSRQSRCSQAPDEPGAEMQHDTTVYSLKLGEQPHRVVASVLYLRYSKRRYLKFYRCFNRFQMKCFLHEALTYWGYARAKPLTS